MSTKLFAGQEDSLRDYYEQVRDDGNEQMIWCAFPYDGKVLGEGLCGTDYDELLLQFTDDARVYAYVRFETGDEMSRRAKFAFITWIGPAVSPLKKAAVSTDKAFVKNVWPQFSKEILADDKSDVKYDKVLAILEKASGAAYGTGK